MKEKLIKMPDFMVVLKAMDDDITRTTMEIQDKTKITNSHIYMLKKLLLKKEWLSAETTDLRSNLKITEKGKELVKAITVLLDLMGIKENDLYIAKPRNKLNQINLIDNKVAKEEIKQEETIKEDAKEGVTMKKDDIKLEPTEEEPEETEEHIEENIDEIFDEEDKEENEDFIPADDNEVPLEDEDDNNK
jgi:hypothetical protein